MTLEILRQLRKGVILYLPNALGKFGWSEPNFTEGVCVSPDCVLRP